MDQARDLTATTFPPLPQLKILGRTDRHTEVRTDGQADGQTGKGKSIIAPLLCRGIKNKQDRYVTFMTAN